MWSQPTLIRIFSKSGGGKLTGVQPPIQNSGGVATPPPSLAPLTKTHHFKNFSGQYASEQA